MGYIVRTDSGSQSFDTAADALVDAYDKQTNGIIARIFDDAGKELTRSDLQIAVARERNS